MINTRTIGVLVLSIVFLLCMPVHIFSETLTSHHTSMHHVDTGAVANIFAHFNDMVNAPWVAVTIDISNALVVWFAIHQAILILSALPARHPFREQRDTHTDHLCAYHAVL